MICLKIHSFSIWVLLLMVSINLFHHISVTESQSTSKRNQVLGNKNLKKEKQSLSTTTTTTTTTKPAKVVEKVVKKDIEESETQRAIDDVFEIEVTTLIIDPRVATNATINQKNSTHESNSTSNQTSLMFNNETEITTPLFNSNVTTNDSLVPIIDETLDYRNSTENELSLNLTTLLSINSINDTTLTPNITENITNQTEPTESSNSKSITEVTDTLHESPILSSTVSAIEALTDSNIDSNIGLSEELEKCVFDKQIQCKNYDLICYGSGEVDCGQRGKRSAHSLTLENRSNERTDKNIEVFKQYLEKQSLSESIQNSKCVLTPFESTNFWCDPFPLINDCSGRSICKPTDEETPDLSEGMPFWKVGLIAALTAIGFICFIIVAVIAYVSYNKLKVRPESSTNGYQSNPQNVTRV